MDSSNQEITGHPGPGPVTWSPYVSFHFLSCSPFSQCLFPRTTCPHPLIWSRYCSSSLLFSIKKGICHLLCLQQPMDSYQNQPWQKYSIPIQVFSSLLSQELSQDLEHSSYWDRFGGIFLYMSSKLLS